MHVWRPTNDSRRNIFFFKKQVTQKLPIDISYQQVSILFSSIHNLQYNRLENKGLDIA